MRLFPCGPRRPVVFLGAALVLALGCTHTPSAPLPDNTPDTETYVIGRGDVLTIRVWKNPELSVEAPVRPDGMISVPLLDDIQAAGLSTLDLKELLTREMGEFVSNPDITVVVQSTTSKRAYVIGEVRQPGPVLLATDMFVLDVLAQAGGFSSFADKGEVKVIRRVDGQELEYVFDYDAYVSGKAPGTNIRILPGDTVVVPD